MDFPALISPVGTGWKQPRVLFHLVVSKAVPKFDQANASYITSLTGPFESHN